MQEVRLVFDGPMARDVPSLIAIEDSEGRSITVGHWRQRQDGYWELVIRCADPIAVVECSNQTNRSGRAPLSDSSPYGKPS
jgi:hypothetical protein